MNLRRKKKITAEVATSSMNDIMFFLMLFFLIMSTLLNPNVVKVVLDAKGLAAYFSRAPIPWGREHVNASWWKNPNATTTCGCGSSFSVAEE